MMHGSKLYGCVCEPDITNKKVTPVNSFCDDSNPSESMDAYCSNYYYLSDDSLFYMTTKKINIGKKTVLHSEIKFV